MNTQITSGAIAATCLLLLYAGTMTALAGWGAAVEQFQALWYLMLPLIIGFGIQVGLFTKLRLNKKQSGSRSIATGGTSAGISMLACCAHHTADIFPILGLSAASAILATYQKPILVISLMINVIGIITLWKKFHH